MLNDMTQKHTKKPPNLRSIRRACRRELERTIKKLKQWIPSDQVKEAEELYYKQVLLNLTFIVDNSSNRKIQANWWEEHVAPGIASIWNVDVTRLTRAFRDSYGG